MTAPNIRTPSRILSPEEFQQLQAGGDPGQLPKLPPVPKPTSESTRVGAESPNPNARPLTGLARILTKYVAEPVLDHPLLTAGLALAQPIPGVGQAIDYAFMGLMGKDVLEYSAQRSAELSLPEDERKLAEQDPTRISGENAAVDAAFLFAPAIGKSVAKKVIDRADGVVAAAPTGNPLDPRTPTTFTGEHADRGAAASAAIEAGNVRRAGTDKALLESSIDAHVDDVTDAVKEIAPGKQAENIIRASTGEAAAVYEQAALKVDEFRRAVDPLPLADKLGFADAIEHGDSQPSELFQKAADTMRSAFDSQVADVQALGTGALEHFIQDYFPHWWEDPEAAATAFEAERAKMARKGPFEGSKASLKERTIPTTLDGVKLGLKPKFENPVDLFLFKLRDMQKYITAHRSLNEMNDAGLLKFVRPGGEIPEGYAKIDDKITKVFGPKQGMVDLPEGANISPEDVNVIGTRQIGEYWAPKEVAKVVNNHLSPGLAQQLRETIKGPGGDAAAAALDAYRGLGNTLNQAQLGLSAFHVGFTSMDATVSRTALGLEYLAEGKPIKGLGEILSAPLAPVTNLMKGAKVRAAYLRPEAATPDMVALANAVKEAGGRVRQDSFYSNSSPEKFMSAFRQGDAAMMARFSIPAFFEAAAKPIMEHIVPLQKLGIFADLAEKELAKLPLDATLAQRRASLALAWDSVDNRMGQLVYDNLFWNRVFKDLAMSSVRSVGWNLGTIRELGGGLKDLGQAVASGKDFELSHRAAYVVSLPIIVGLYGAAYQLLRTGEPPKEMKDYFFPRTGDVDVDGNPDRVQLPSYMKDMFAYGGHPWETIKHKVSPAAAEVLEMLNNADYYGDQIRNPNDPITQQFLQEARYVAKSALPFAISNMTESRARGDSFVSSAQSFVGVTPAPREDVRSDAQNLMASFLKQRQMTGATPEDAEARKSRSQLLAALRSNKDGNQTANIEDAVTAAIERHQLTPKDVTTLLKRAGVTPAEERFQRLSLDQAVQVFKLATPEEKEKFARALLKKVQNAVKRGQSVAVTEDPGEVEQTGTPAEPMGTQLVVPADGTRAPFTIRRR